MMDVGHVPFGLQIFRFTAIIETAATIKTSTAVAGVQDPGMNFSLRRQCVRKMMSAEAAI